MICFRRDGWVGFLKRVVGMICFGAAFSVVFPGNTVGQTNRTAIPAQINRNIESIKPASVQIDPKIHSAEQGEVVEFSCQASGFDIVGWNWSVGNLRGSDSVFRVNTKALQPGSYIVILTVVDSQKQTMKTRAQLIVNEQTSFEVQIDPKIQSVEQGEVVEFLCRLSGAEIVGWNWTVGDQRGNDPEFRVNTELMQPDNYTVSLTVADSRQQTRKATARLVVKAREISSPEVFLAADPNPGKVNEKINFHLSINTWPEGAYCRLDFGDETMELQPVNEEERNVAHTYRKAGNYMVKAEIRSETDRIISAGSVEIVIEAEAVAWKMMIIPVIAICVMSLAVYLLRSRFSNNANKQKENEDPKSNRDASSAMEIKVKPDLIGTQEIESSSQKTLRTCMSIRVRVDPGTQEIIHKRPFDGKKWGGAMNTDNITLNDFFDADHQKISEKFGSLHENNREFASIRDTVISGMTKDAKHFPSEIFRGKIRKFLEVNFLDVLTGAWNKYESIRRYADAGGETDVVELFEHTIKSKHYPVIEVLVKGRIIHEFEFCIELRLDLKGFILTIEDGKIMSIKTGTCKGEGTISYEGFNLFQRETGPFVLPGTISLEPGVPITQNELETMKE